MLDIIRYQYCAIIKNFHGPGLEKEGNNCYNSDGYEKCLLHQQIIIPINL
jgi:hypothetical protein